MNPSSSNRRIFFYLAVILVLLGVTAYHVVSTGYLNRKADFSAVTKSSLSGASNTTTNDVANQSASSLEALRGQAALNQSRFQVAQRVHESIYGKSFDKLVGSEDPAQIDYAMGVLSLNCFFVNRVPSTDSFEATFLEPHRQELASAQIRGLGAEQSRKNAWLRHGEKCMSVFGNRVLTDGDYRAIKEKGLALKAPIYELNKAKTRAGGFQIDDPQIAGLLKEAMGKLHLGVLNVSLSEIESVNAQHQNGGPVNQTLAGLAELGFQAVLMCRLGVPCDDQSTHNHALCAEVGFCGVDVETAVFQFYQSNGLRVNELDAHLRKVQAAFANSDLSVFKKR
jgi:hypothetical protein